MEKNTLPGAQDLEIPWHLRFRGDLEKAFSGHFRDTSRTMIITSSLVMLLVYLAAFLLEWYVEADVLHQTWRARFLAVISLCGVLLVALHPQYGRYQQPVIALMALVTAGAHLYMGIHVEHALSHTYFFIVFVAILLMATIFRVTLQWALPVTIVILLGSALVLLGSSGPSHDEAVVVLSYLASLSVITLAGMYFHERLQRRLFVSEQLMALHRTELHDANLVLSHQASRDSLTGTVNRRGMDERLERLVREYHRQERDTPDSVAMLLFDIDDFKPYNDTYGHQKGDEALARVARVPQDMIQRARDFVARYGGEEFVVALWGTKLEDALVFAERLRTRVEKLGIPHPVSRSADVITISIGVACTNADHYSTDELISRADRALYAAKSAGRNRTAATEEDGTVRLLSP